MDKIATYNDLITINKVLLGTPRPSTLLKSCITAYDYKNSLNSKLSTPGYTITPFRISA